MADSAHTTDLSRRTMFRRIPAAALVTTAVFSALPILSARPVDAEAADEQFLAWEREWNRYRDAFAIKNKTDDEIDQLADEQQVFETLIFETPSATRCAAGIKARLVLRYVRESLMDDLASPLEHILAALN